MFYVLLRCEVWCVVRGVRCEEERLTESNWGLVSSDWPAGLERLTLTLLSSPLSPFLSCLACPLGPAQSVRDQWCHHHDQSDLPRLSPSPGQPQLPGSHQATPGPGPGSGLWGGAHPARVSSGYYRGIALHNSLACYRESQIPQKKQATLIIIIRKGLGVKYSLILTSS